MKKRCTSSNDRHHRYYDRGIYVCDEWQDDFLSFANWALENGYKDSLSLDRIDNDKGYSPENCRWATPKDQSNNMSRNRYLTLNGESHTIAEWSRILGINHDTLHARVRNGWGDEKALTTTVGILVGKRRRNAHED
jgi:hypothetical protein